uniref:Uncharacterized protein n=1 Tax=Arundo donax TaxID=35708 RepID=A0A0A9B7N8_ARUDO
MIPQPVCFQKWKRHVLMQLVCIQEVC